jgi:ABC-2 type transport system permease protein
MILSNTLSGCDKIKSQAFYRLIDGIAKAAGFVRKDMAIAISYKFQFIFQFLQVFFSIAMIFFIGKMLGTSSLLKSYGTDYFSFALVGLAVASYLKAGLVTLTNDMRQIMNQGVLEAMCVCPIGYKLLLFCTALWPFIFETIRITFYFFVGMVIFGARFGNANWLGASITMILTIPIFLMLGMISCSILVLIKRGDPINWIFSSASSLLAGTMFPISVLPNWLRVVALCLPLTHSLEAMRKFLLVGASVHEARINLLALFLFMAALLPVTFFVNNICMNRAKRFGAFSTH